MWENDKVDLSPCQSFSNEDMYSLLTQEMLAFTW